MIRVLHNYGGQPTGFQRIEAGDYADNDSRLMSLGNYLIKNGHAVYVPDSDAAPVSDPVEFSEPETEIIASTRQHVLASMTVDELESLAQDYGIYEDIEGNGSGGRILKGDLVNAIAEYEAE